MAVCRFWQGGYCRNGADCKFEHPGSNQGNNNQSNNNNRFLPLSGSSAGSSSSRRNDDPPYLLSADTIRRDLTEERPPWILSCFGPGRDAPAQLFGGFPREQSFEELRLHYDAGVAAGNAQGAAAEIGALYRSAEQQIQHALGNLDAAIRFVVESGEKHPNRLDVVRQGGQGGGQGAGGAGVFGKKATAPTTAAANPFGGQSGAFAAAGQSLKPPFGPASGTNTSTASGFGNAGGFGQPSAPGQKASPFGTPSFGTPSFGQPTQPGGGSAFGQPPKPGGFGTMATKPNPFGAPSQPATSASGPFGQPSQPASASPFGQPSLPATSSSFGQPSQPAAASPFGRPTQPAQATSTPFGQPRPANATPAFGTSAFGQPSQPVASAPTSGFGQPTAMGTKPNPFSTPSPSSAAAPATANLFATATPSQAGGGTPNPFANPASSSSPFGAATANASPAANPFGQPSGPPGSGLGSQPAATGSPFGQPSAPAPSNPFGQPSQQSRSAPSQGIAANPFGAPSGEPSSQPFGAHAAAAEATTTTTTTHATTTGMAAAHDPYPPSATRKHPPLAAYAARQPDGRLASWHGQPVVYQLVKASAAPVPMVRVQVEGRPLLKRIFFPDGPPAYSAETEVKQEEAGVGGVAVGVYDETSKVDWARFAETGRFAGARMPLLPPMREVCRWDF